MTETSEQITVRKRPKDRADRIRAAAAKLFREHGYHDVGMADVGAAVGITASAVYRHFRSKEALLIAVTEHEVARLAGKVERAAEKGLSPLEVLELIDAALTRETIRERIIATMYTREVRHAPFEDRAGIRVRQQAMTARWSGALREARPELEAVEAEYIVLSSYGVLASQSFFDSPLSRRRQEELLTELCLAAQLAWQPPADHARAAVGDEVTSHRAAGVIGATADLDRPVAVAARASRREMILQAAVGLFRRFGYQGVGIDEIGAAAGISGPGVYRHFKGKEEILLAAYQRAWEQMMAGAAQALGGPGSALEVMERLASSYVSVAFENADLIVIYLRDDQHLAEEQRRELRHKQRLYVDEWVRALRELRGEIDEDEARIRVHAALGIVNSAVDIPTRLGEAARREMVQRMVEGALLGA